LSTLFYIPCLFSGVFDSIGKFAVGQYNASSMGSLLMLIFAIILLVVYFTMPSLFNLLNMQGGKQLVNKPVYTDAQYSLATYEQLNGNNNFDYQYDPVMYFADEIKELLEGLRLKQKSAIAVKPSSGVPCARRFTNALPTIAASAPQALIWAACSGSEIPKPTPIGLSVTVRNWASKSSTRVATWDLTPVTPVTLTK
jgi:hypothetical protein